MNDRDRLVELLDKVQHYGIATKTGINYIQNSELVDHLIENGVTIPVRCKDCKYHYWEQEPCHGKTEHFCSVLKAQVFADFYCYHGKRKENGDE